jgi:hypothetical protein
MTLTDDLAQTLVALAASLRGYKNCPTMLALAASADDVLARYAEQKALEAKQAEENRCQRWARTHGHEALWLDWLPEQERQFRLWLQSHHPKRWEEFIGAPR